MGKRCEVCEDTLPLVAHYASCMKIENASVNLETRRCECKSRSRLKRIFRFLCRACKIFKKVVNLAWFFICLTSGHVFILGKKRLQHRRFTTSSHFEVPRYGVYCKVKASILPVISNQIFSTMKHSLEVYLEIQIGKSTVNFFNINASSFLLYRNNLPKSFSSVTTF